MQNLDLSFKLFGALRMSITVGLDYEKLKSHYSPQLLYKVIWVPEPEFFEVLYRFYVNFMQFL